MALNDTATCLFNGVEYHISAASSDLSTCESVVRDIAVSVVNSANDRSVNDVLLTCLATIFACTWVSVHPNIPHPDATEWKIRRHRCFLMLAGLIAPELIVLWALRQWMGALFLVKKMKEKNIQGFTRAHAHFMQMGGFMLYSRGARIGVIEDHNQLVSYITDWKFALPTVDEIQDRSKGDGLSKALVAGQTGWFIAQCISRWVSGLAITEMELVTLAFAALNGIVYFLWWDKPLDIRCAVSVTRKIEASVPGDDDSCRSLQDASFATTSSTRSFYEPGWKARAGDLQGIRRLLMNSRLGRLVAAFRSRASQETEGRRLRVSILHSSCEPQDSFAATALASAAAILFGAIHCIAWNFHFLSPVERTMWIIWSSTITTTPIILFLKSVLTYLFVVRLVDEDDPFAFNWRMTTSTSSRTLMGILTRLGGPSIWATVLLVPAYIIARIGLLVQAIVSLRELQPSERSQVQWVDLMPHL